MDARLVASVCRSAQSERSDIPLSLALSHTEYMIVRVPAIFSSRSTQGVGKRVIRSCAPNTSGFASVVTQFTSEPGAVTVRPLYVEYQSQQVCESLLLGVLPPAPSYILMYGTQASVARTP